MSKSTRSTDQLPTFFSIETLHNIVRNCQRNEQRLQELKRHTRRERKKAERLLRETHQNDNQTSANPKLTQQQSIKFFISLDDDITKRKKNRHNNRNQARDKLSLERVDRKKLLKQRQQKSIHSTRVRFDIPENNKNIQTDHFIISSNERKTSINVDVKLDELLRQCQDLLLRLHIHHTQAAILDNDDYHPQRKSPTQQALELVRPTFISHSRQHINLLREDQQILPSSHSNLIKHQEMQPASQKKHDQGLISEIQRRNHLRTEILRIRLRQHDLLQGRTNINESLKMIDT